MTSANAPTEAPECWRCMVPIGEPCRCDELGIDGLTIFEYVDRDELEREQWSD